LLDPRLVYHIIVDQELAIAGRKVVRLLRGFFRILSSLAFSVPARSYEVLPFEIGDLPNFFSKRNL